MAYFTSLLVINANTWEGLSDDVRKVIREAAAARSREQLERLQTFLDEGIALFKDKGVNVHVATDKEIGAFREHMAPVYDWWTGQVEGAEAYIEFAKEHR